MNKKDDFNSGFMLKEDREFLIWILSLLITFFFTLPMLYAGESPAASGNALLSEQAIQKKVEYWKHLKQKDPAAFDQLVQRRKEEIKNTFSSFKEKNPQKFEALQKLHLDQRRGRLQRMRRENPEAFRQAMENKAAHLRRWSQANPERFQKFLENHPNIAQRIQNGNLPFQPLEGKEGGRPERTGRIHTQPGGRMERPSELAGPRQAKRENFRERGKDPREERLNPRGSRQNFRPPFRPGEGNRFQGSRPSSREGMNQGPRNAPAASRPRAGGVGAKPQGNQGNARGNAPSRPGPSGNRGGGAPGGNGGGRGR